jgi:peroxiredoxin Q/BCP
MSESLLNKPAPDFTLLDDNNTARSLAEFKGKKIVLYFYPKDDTPGCTTEACSFRDNFAEYGKKNITVLGINYDTPESHKKFKAKYLLPFILLSDSTKEVAQKYGAYASILNILFPKRITFLIDEQGIIIHILDNVDVKNDAQKIIDIFSKNAPH